jgi:hypothetical protein
VVPARSVKRLRSQLADRWLPCRVDADLVDAVAAARAADQAWGAVRVAGPQRKLPLRRGRPADALAGRLASDGFWIDRERGSCAYAFPDDVTHQQGKQALLAALDHAAPADRSNKLGWLRWLEVQD